MDKNQGTFVTDITNKDELNEIDKIKNMLNPNEKVLLVARQSRFLPGGSALTPNVVKPPVAKNPTNIAERVLPQSSY